MKAEIKSRSPAFSFPVSALTGKEKTRSFSNEK